MSKRVISLLLIFSLFFSTAAYAWFWPIVAGLGQAAVITARFLSTPVTNTVVALGRTASANLTVWKIGETVATGAVVSTVLLSTDDAIKNSASASHAQVVVNLNSSKPKRANPDSSTWNDASEDEIDPTPKSSDPTLPSSSLAPVSGATVSNGGQLLYDSASNNYIVKPAPSIISSRSYVGGSKCAHYTFTSSKATCSEYVTVNEFSVSNPATVVTTAPVTVANMVISYEKYLSSVSSKGTVVYVDVDNALRYTWVAYALAGYSASSPAVYDDVVVAGTECNPNNSSACYSVYTSDPNNSAAAQSYANLMDARTITVSRSVTADSSFSAVVRFEGGYYHNVKVESLCGSGQTYNTALSACVSKDSVVKPATLACEVVYTDGAFQLDSRNPNCSTVADRLAVGGNVVKLTSGKGETEVVMNSDGSYTITTNEDGTWKTINTSPYSGSGGGAPVSDVTDSATGSFQYGSVGSGSGSGSGSCGGTGQPSCSINDSGFDGKSDEIKGKLDQLGEAEGTANKLLDDYVSKNGGENFGFAIDWFPRLWPDPVACEDIDLTLGFDAGPLSGLTSTSPIVFCEKAQSIKQFMSWLVYVIGVIYLWRSLMSSNKK